MLSKQKSHKIYYYLGVCFFVVFLMHYAGWLRPVENFFRSNVFNPVLSRMHSLGVSVTKDNFDVENVNYEIYKQTLEKVQVLETENDQLKKENEDLKSLSSFVENQSFEKITAKVISKNINSIEKTIIIDAGFKNGIRTGLAVLVKGNNLVGRVIRVEENMSVVRLINDNQSKIGATLSNKDESLGVVEGGYGLTLRMNFIPRNEVVMVGDKITTSNIEKDIPPGLLLGSVAAIENESYKPFQQAIVEPVVNLEKIILVTILKDKISD